MAIRSVMETPILDEHKWAKVPSIRADAWILDMEDSVPPQRKLEGRERVVEYCRRPEFFGGSAIIPRPNPLGTEWGRDDLVAVAAAQPEFIMIAKVQSAGDVYTVKRILNAAGSDPEIWINIETALGVVNIDEIARVEKVVALMFGPGDLSLDMGIEMYDPDGALNRGLLHAQMRITTAAAAFGLAATWFSILPDLRDLAEVRARLLAARRYGFTNASTFYPPHVDIINDVFTPSDEEIAHAEETMRLIEAARAAGEPAVVRPSGQAVLIHDYEKARKTLEKAGRSV